MPYTFLEKCSSTGDIFVNGERVTVCTDRSLLAALLAAGVECDLFCGIGQCQRCVVRVDGVRRPACMVRATAGADVILPAAPRRGDRESS